MVASAPYAASSSGAGGDGGAASYAATVLARTTTTTTTANGQHQKTGSTTSRSSKNAFLLPPAPTSPISPLEERIRKLMHPQPTSYTLTAALQLLQKKAPHQTVFLMNVDYLQNWLQWAYHQPISSPNSNSGSGSDEQARVKEALRLAAVQEGLPPPNEFNDNNSNGNSSNSFTDPGPVDATALSVEGHPLLLSPFVRILRRGHHPTTAATATLNNSGHHQHSASYAFQRTHSSATSSPGFMNDNSSNTNIHSDQGGINNNSNRTEGGAHGIGNNSNRTIYCLAVPEAFYDTLRSVHGVLCDDGLSVAFQADEKKERLLLHHQPYHHQNQQQSQQHDSNHNATRIARPIEFRRKLVPYYPDHGFINNEREQANSSDDSQIANSLMDKLLAEEQQRRQPQSEVEVHPLRLTYAKWSVRKNNNSNNYNDSSTTTPTNATTSKQGTAVMGGFGLASRQALAVDALAALLRAAVPHKATDAARLWAKSSYNNNNHRHQNQNNEHPPQHKKTNGSSSATAAGEGAGSSSSCHCSVGDGYELVDLQALETERVSLQEFVERLTATPTATTATNSATTTLSKPCFKKDQTEIHLLIETRNSVNADWPRHSLELSERIAVGDFVDAQDVAGRWYEAVVRHVDDTSVTVHYLGWASRWDLKIRRKPKETSEGKNNTTSPSPNTAGFQNRVQPPVPLWTRTQRWRERLAPGDTVEVRDSSSLAERPKWYRGIVKKVGSPNDPVQELVGGAELETYAIVTTTNDDDNNKDNKEEKKERLLLLKRTQQLLVEVEQEKTQKPGLVAATSPAGEGDLAASGLTPQPPYLRWVDLYGEEICRLGTHLKEKDQRQNGPVTLRYEYEADRKPVEVLKTQRAHGSGFVRESLRGTPPAPGSVGLHNLGNSCFLNSTVQCLNHIEPLTQYFLRDKHCPELNRKNPLGSGGNVANAYASLLKKMWGGEYSVLAPRMLKQTVAAFAPQFDNSYQHDSQEFCQFLMDGLHEDLNRVKSKPYVDELEGFGMEDSVVAIESWRKHLLRHDSIIVDLCQGMHRSHLTCPRCGRESIKFDVYSSISLPIVTTKKRTTIKLEDCLEKFLEGEQLDERNAWYCPSCRQHVCALKMIALWSAPDILILHLKRFTFDTCMMSGGMLRSKIDDKVDFPIEGLDLTKHILGPIDPEAPPIYKLFGVSEHMGPTANSGHYTATVRNSIDSQWYRCNDSHVGQTSGEASITGGAYLLFYQRTKGISKWAGMAKVMQERNLNPYGGLETDKEGFTKVKTKKKKKGSDDTSR